MLFRLGLFGICVIPEEDLEEEALVTIKAEISGTVQFLDGICPQYESAPVGPALDVGKDGEPYRILTPLGVGYDLKSLLPVMDLGGVFGLYRTLPFVHCPFAAVLNKSPHTDCIDTK